MWPVNSIQKIWYVYSLERYWLVIFTIIHQQLSRISFLKFVTRHSFNSSPADLAEGGAVSQSSGWCFVLIFHVFTLWSASMLDAPRRRVDSRTETASFPANKQKLIRTNYDFLISAVEISLHVFAKPFHCHFIFFCFAFFPIWHSPTHYHVDSFNIP